MIVSEHPITEQMLAEKNATGHSIFGPSSAHRWFKCPRSLIAGFLAGDRPTIYAAEGSIAHWLAEDWLVNGNPYRHLGTIHEKDGFEIEITEEMISYVEEYVGWVSTTPGRHYVEVKVNLSDYTPVPSFGTSDHIFVDRRHLIVTDLKYGKVIVGAQDNEQGMCYALGAFTELDWLYDFDKITIRICQPRRDHYDEWSFDRERMLHFGEELRAAAKAAWSPDAPYIPHPEACEYCPARTTCPALADVNVRIAQATFGDDDDDMVYTPERAVAVINQTIAPAATLPDYRDMPIEKLAQIYQWRGSMEKWFREAYDYLLMQAELGAEVPGHKLSRGRPGNRVWTNKKRAEQYLLSQGVQRLDLYEHKFASPAGASKLLRLSRGGTVKENDKILSDFAYSPPGKLALIPDVDDTPGLPPAVTAFDEIED